VIAFFDQVMLLAEAIEKQGAMIINKHRQRVLWNF